MGFVICNDGTKDVDNGFVAPCTFNGGVKDIINPIDSTTNTDTETDNGTAITETTPTQKGLTTTQKWLAVIGLTAVCYYILYKAGSLK